MKRIFIGLLFLLVAASAARGQSVSVPQPDCVRTFKVTATGRATLTPGATAYYDNRTTGCTIWALAYSVTGFTGVSIQIENAADTGGIPGNFTVWSPNMVFATTPGNGLPMTDVTGGFASMSSERLWPWVAVDITSLTGTGTLTGVLYGYKTPPPTAPGLTTVTLSPNGPLPNGNNTIGQLLPNQSVNVTMFGGQPVKLGLGPGAYAQRVVLSNDSVARQTPFGVGFNTDYDSGITLLTTSFTVPAATTVAVQNLSCTNITGLAATITITDNQASPVTYIAAFSLSANSTVRFLQGGKGLRFQNGIQWKAGTSSAINCQASGFSQ